MKQLTPDQRKRMKAGLRYALKAIAEDRVLGLCYGLCLAVSMSVLRSSEAKYLQRWIRRMLREAKYLEDWYLLRGRYVDWNHKRRAELRRPWVNWMIRELDK